MLIQRVQRTADTLQFIKGNQLKLRFLHYRPSFPSSIYMFSRTPYNGLFRKLVLAFDVGTTFSGVSYW